MAPVVEPPQDSQIMPSLEIPPTVVVPTTPQEAVVETMPSPSPPPMPARPSSKPPQVPRPVTPTVPEGSELDDSVSQAEVPDAPVKREGYWKLLILNKECKIFNMFLWLFVFGFLRIRMGFSCTSRLYRYFKPKAERSKLALKQWSFGKPRMDVP